MPRSWQEDFFERLVAASHAATDARLSSAKAHPRKKTASFGHPQVRWVECAFDTNRITGNPQSQVLVIEVELKRATELDSSTLKTEISHIGGEVRIEGNLVVVQYRWGFGQGEGFPLHDPRRVGELIDWTHNALRIVFGHLEQRQNVVVAKSSPDFIGQQDYTLALEKYLEDFLVDGWESIPWAASLQYLGRQVPCGDLGFIDILAQDPTNGSFVVIELKRGNSDDEVVGQLSRYMGWIKEHRADPSRVGVSGIIVVHEVTPRLRAASLALANVDLYTYSLAVSLQLVDISGRNVKQIASP